MVSLLRRARVVEGWTLSDVYRMTGIATSKLSLVERGLQEANVKEKKLLAKALGLKPEEVSQVGDQR